MPRGKKDEGELLGEVLFHGSSLKIYQSQYMNGRPAIVLYGGGLPFATLTVNLHESPLKDGEFFVKDWTENEVIAPWILEHTDLFEDTGHAVNTGFVQAPIWRFKREAQYNHVPWSKSEVDKSENERNREG